MKEQSYAYYVERLPKKKQHNIYGHRIIRMQRMEINAASVGLEQRIGYYMVYINQHRSYQN